MPDLLGPGRSVELSTLKQLTTLTGVACTLLAALTTLIALQSLLSGAIIAGLVQFIGGLTLTIFVFCVVRMMAEIIQGQARLHDRLMILADRLDTPSTDKG